MVLLKGAQGSAERSPILYQNRSHNNSKQGHGNNLLIALS